MLFFDKTETEKRKTSILRQQVSDPRPVFYYGSDPANDFLGAAHAFVASFGEFREASLIFVATPFGDGKHETQLSDARWARFYKWREAHGEVRRLYDVPGHQFSANESDALAEAISLALLLGWDAWLEGNRGRKLIVLSHDDRVEMHRGCERHALTRSLLRLGFWQVANVF